MSKTNVGAKEKKRKSKNKHPAIHDLGCTVNTAASVVKPIRLASEGLIYAGCEQQPPHSGCKLLLPEREIKSATRNQYLSCWSVCDHVITAWL